MSVTEIEAAIRTLPREELARFNAWYQEFVAEQWDEQIRKDMQAGKLDFLLEEARKERKAGTLKRFP
jgi:hypothetical protein